MGNRGPPSFFSRKGALTHHRVGTNSISFAPPQAAGLIHSVVPPFPTKSTTLWEPFCGGGMPCGIVRSPRGTAAAAAASRQCHSTCGCCCHRLRRRQIPCDGRRELGQKFSAPVAACLRKPATGSFAAERAITMRDSPFLFCERETEKKE